jgi:large subunit ribosomal protein L30e
MAKKQEIDSRITELKSAIPQGRLVLGTQKTLKELKHGKLEKVFLSANVPKDVRADIEHYSALTGTVIEELNVPNEELGILVKKPFSVSIIGLARE